MRIFLIIFLFLLSVNTAHALGPAIPKNGDIVTSENWSTYPVWSPDGKLVAVGWSAEVVTKNNDGSITTQFDENTFQKDRVLILDSANYRVKAFVPYDISGFGFSPDSNLLVLSNGTIYNTVNGRMVFSLPSLDRVIDCIEWFPDSRRVAYALRERAIEVWDIHQKEKLLSIPNDWRMFESVALSPNAKYLSVTGSDERRSDKFAVYDLASKRMLIEGGDDRSYSAAWSEEGNYFAFTDGDLHILDAEQLCESSKLPDCISFAWSPSGQKLASVHGDGSIKITAIPFTKPSVSIQAEKNGAVRVQWWNSDDFIVLTDVFSTAICDAGNGEYLGSVISHDFGLCLSPGNQYILLGSPMERSLRFLKIDTTQRDKGESVIVGGKRENPWKDQHLVSNLEDAFDEFKRALSKDQLDAFRKTPENKLDRYNCGIGLGMWVRNWVLYRNGPLVKLFLAKGVNNSRNMSSILIETFWCQQNNKPLDFERRCADAAASERFDAVVVPMNRPLPEVLLKHDFVNVDRTKFTLNNLNLKRKVIAIATNPSLEHVIRKTASDAEFGTDLLSDLVILVPKNSDGKNSGVGKFHEVEHATKVNYLNLGLANGPKYVGILEEDMEDKFYTFIANERPAGVKDAIIWRSQIFVVNEENIVTHRIAYEYLQGPQLMKVLRRVLNGADKPK